MRKPTTSCSQVPGTRFSVIPRRITPTKIAPTIGAKADPRPPEMLVPPKTTAAMTRSSKPVAAVTCNWPICPMKTAEAKPQAKPEAIKGKLPRIVSHASNYAVDFGAEATA